MTAVDHLGDAASPAPEADVQDALHLDRVVHEPARLVILAALASAQEVDFTFLQMATGLTKGNLSRHAARLEEAGYIAIRKYFKGKIPATGYRITEAGQGAFTSYWQSMAALGQSLGKISDGQGG